MKCLITGAAGFIGSHLFNYLLERKFDVLGLDNYEIGTFRHERIISVDLFHERDKLEEIINKFKPDILYHLAAWAHEGLSQFCPIKITENNYNAYLNTLVPCIKNNLKKVVLASSISVYGDQKPPFFEQMKKMPKDIYAVSKSAMEDATSILSYVHNFEYAILRLHNVYGPGQNLSDPYRNVVAIFINRLLVNKPFYIYGNGKQKRAFTFIDDIVPCIARAGFKPVEEKIINIGADRPVTINRPAKIILTEFFRSGKNKIDNPKVLKPLYLEDRPLEVMFAWSLNKTAKKQLGYKDKTSTVDGIKKTINWAKKVGHKKTRYLAELELVNKNTPQTWTDHLL